MAAYAGAFEHHLAARIGGDALLVRSGRRGRRGCGQVGRGRRRHAAQIGDDGADVFRGQLAETVVDGFAHRSRCRAMARSMPGRKIGGEVLIRPAANAGALVRADVEGAPAGRHGAGEFVAVVERKGEVARRMAFAAMRQCFHKIRAPVPLRTLRCVGCKARVGVKHRRPEQHRPALVERERKRILGRRRAHRWQAEQIGLHRQHVFIAHVGVGRVRHRRIKHRAVAALAALDRVQKILIAVIADAGFLVRGDVGRIQRAERQFEAETAGKFLFPRFGVADHAVRRLGQIFAAFDQARLLEPGRDAGRFCAAIIRERDLGAAGEGERTGSADDPGAERDRRNDDDGEAHENTHSPSHAFFPAAISERSIGMRRNATPVAA